MTDLRIVDAPVLLQESITDDVKMPTGGLGNFSVRLGDIVWYVVTKENLASKSYVDLSSKGVKDKLDNHIADKANPHQVTKEQVGLGNVDNTADIDKPVSNAVNSAISTATNDMATKAYVNQKYNLKADKATTLSGYGIADAYNKNETYASVSTARTSTYPSTINPALIKNPDGLPIYDSVLRKLYIASDTAINTKDGAIDIADSEIDIGTKLLAFATSLVKVYYDKATKAFVVYRWNTVLTALEESTFYLFCTVRDDMGWGGAGALSIGGTFDYKIDICHNHVPSSRNKASIISGMNTTNAATNFPNYNSTAHTLTLAQDTVLRYMSHIWIISQPLTIDLSAVGTSAMVVYWDVIANTFNVRRYDYILKATEAYRWVVLCVVRDRGVNSPLANNIALDIGCPYSINGVLFGIVASGGSSENGVVQNRLDDTVKAVAHRGYSAEAPENTLPAYVLAKKKGYSYCETDINFTSDGVPMLLHDDSINRTSTGQGNLRDLTYAQVRTYDFGAWKGAQYAGTKIPTFEEFLQLCFKLGLHPYCEWKQGLPITNERAQLLANIVRSCGMRGKMTYISFSYDALVKLMEFDPYARLGFLASADTNTINMTNALKTGTNQVFLDCDYGSLSREDMTYAQSKDVPVEIWTVNDSTVLANYAKWGVSGITTDSLNVRQILNASEGI